MLTWNTLILMGIVFAFITSFATGKVRNYLIENEILDLPNERSSHTIPVPRGGGIAVISSMLLGWIILTGLLMYDTEKNFTLGHGIWLVFGCGAGLAAMSWIDDRKNLSAAIRLCGHFAAVGIALTTFPSDTVFFNGLLPVALDWAAAAIIWVWFINLYNFMDGIDGITGIETSSIGIAIALLATLGVLPFALGAYGVILAAVAFGFLFWNWPPAKIFLGDVGSVPLGFFSGWLLMLIVAEGKWYVSVIIPLYYLCDATFTLTRRALRFEKIWEAHKEHYYQLAVQKGADTRKLLMFIYKANLALAVLALITHWTSTPEGIVLFSLILVGKMINSMHNWGEKEPSLKEGAQNMVKDFNSWAEEIGNSKETEEEKEDEQESDDEKQDEQTKSNSPEKDRD